MSDRLLVPKVGPVVTAGELIAEASGPQVDHARRFSMIVTEEALQRMGPIAIQFVTERLAQQIAHEQCSAVEETVHAFLRDRTWAEPIIRQAIQDEVGKTIRDMLVPGAGDGHDG